MNWLQPIRNRFNDSHAQIHGRWVCEAGNSKCELNFRTAPANSLMLSIDLLEAYDAEIRSSIDREKHCDYVSFGCHDGTPYLILVEVKGGKRAKPSRIRRAKLQIRNSEQIVTNIFRRCHELPEPLNKYHVVVTRRVRPSTLNKWLQQRDGQNLLRDIILVFSGDDIWQTIQQNTI